MNEPFDRILKQTLDDHRVSRGEKRVVAETLRELAPDAHDLAVLRSRAFELARAELSSADAAGVLTWLEEVNKLLLPPDDNQKDADDRVEAFFSPHDNIPNRIVHMIDRTSKRLDICVFTITDNRIADALIEAAGRRVAVRIVTDNEKSEDLGSDIVRLGRAGIAIRIDRSESHMHHKFALFDRDIVLTGSYNWTRSAADQNQENVIVTRDRRLARPFEREFERLWEAWK